MKFLGLLVESPLRSSARASLLRHASFDLGHALRTAVVDAYEARRANEAAEAYVTHTLLTVGSRRMGSCLRGEPWCDEMSGSVDVKRAWAAYRAGGAS